MKSVKLVDLSMPMENCAFFPRPATITHIDHHDWTKQLCRLIDGVKPTDFPNGISNAMDYFSASTHTGTHLDAPLHYAPVIKGQPAKSIDQVPLEWLYGDGVVLDFRYKKAGEFITLEDVKTALNKINYTLKPWDILLIMTGAAAQYDTNPDYANLHAGMSKEATIWLIDQGIKVMGIDAINFDIPFKYMSMEYKKGNKEAVMATHCGLGQDREYVHMENLINLEKLPSYGFEIVCFPIKIAKATGGYVRAVAIIRD